MKSTTLLFIAIAFTIFGCSNDDQPSPALQGEFEGTFLKGGSSVSRDADLTLENGEFWGESTGIQIYYGEYTLYESNIIFENLKVIEPLSASDVVLNGIWNYTLNNDNLTITYPSTGDVFQLSKKQ